ncbi:probable pectinesterase 29 [Fagus crenata]
MQLLPTYIFFILVTSSRVSRAVDCGNENIESTITVDKSVKPDTGVFQTIQDAIDSIPLNNDQWIKVHISPGIYNEKVTIPQEKPCIFLEGSGRNVTTIKYDDHGQTDTSATFTSSPDNVVAKGITFQNSYNRASALTSYNRRMAVEDSITWALAARIYGDKSAFLECGFLGFQDTLWDARGRHYFNNTYIEGGIDFIWGNGQSVYENCMINVTAGILPEGIKGYITAQDRKSADEPTGFLFRGGSVSGSGQAFLGRAYGPYSRVIFQETTLSEVVTPEGWFAWNYQGQE